MSQAASQATSESTVAVRRIEHCRACGGALSIPFCDLGSTPLANSYVRPEAAGSPDPSFPLCTRVCERCFLVQLDHVVDATAIFSDYAYFSSFSSTWMAHSAAFAAEATRRFGLGAGSFVVEVASNDGYLLRNFVAAGIPCLGVEPAANVAQAAIDAGVPTDVRFFGQAVAADIVARQGHADLIVANNVLAHVPDVNDFVAGLATLAGSRGVVSVEAPHLLELIAAVQFDTIYHEHYAYWSLHAMERLFAAHGLVVFDVEPVPTHGGSLRVMAMAEEGRRGEDMWGEGSWGDPTPRLARLRAREAAVGVTDPGLYAGFDVRVRRVIDAFRTWLAAQNAAGRTVAAFGAAAKGNTFLNAAGIHAPDIAFVVDSNPAKQSHLMPGSRIPILAPAAVMERRPDDLVILPWNIAAELKAKMRGIAGWGGRFVTAIPTLRVEPA